MSIQILSPGPLTTVQDLGRHGYMKDGFSPSGAMDARAAVTANLLVGNDKNDAVLEMTLMGITARVLDRTVIAFAGGDFSPKINGAAVPMMQAIAVFTGDEIAMGFAASGCRAYMAVRGGIDVPLVMGSRSTNLKARVGGFEGRKLMAGDVLPVFPVLPLSEEEIARRHLPYAPYFENGSLSGPRGRPLSGGGAFRLFFGGIYRDAGVRPHGNAARRHAACFQKRRGYRFGRHRDGKRSDSAEREADHFARRPADGGRICEACDGHHSRYSASRAGEAGRPRPVCPLHA